MAAAYSARQLGVPATIVVPSVTPNLTVERLKDEGATVVIHGKVSQCMFLTAFFTSYYIAPRLSLNDALLWLNFP